MEVVASDFEQSKSSNIDPKLYAAIEKFYAKHNPEKVDELPKIVGKYKGNEIELIRKLEKKYDDTVLEGITTGLIGGGFSAFGASASSVSTSSSSSIPLGGFGSAQPSFGERASFGTSSSTKIPDSTSSSVSKSKSSFSSSNPIFDGFRSNTETNASGFGSFTQGEGVGFGSISAVSESSDRDKDEKKVKTAGQAEC